MQELINGFYALSVQEREHYILAIAPAICQVFQNNLDSIPRFCDQLRDGENGQVLTAKLREALEQMGKIQPA
ncbi:hypothetical protein LJC26_05565 [Desulfovibrio sp. OttesenSCG-928-O18]|nr:hypothetical protein [Desulfovibrio sp. OttesenSCG-928-O18]